jgi:large subunit ribosomal protein L7/L12
MAEEKNEEQIKVPEKFKKLVEEIEKMSVLDLAELVKVLEKKFGVSAQALIMAAAPSAGAGPAGAAETAAGEEKTAFSLQLKAVGDKRVDVIKVVRELTEKPLKEAMDLVNAAAAEPQTVKEGMKKEQAEEAKKKFEAAGAAVELK